MKKMRNILLFSLLALAACKKEKNNPEDPINPNETELITTLQLKLTNTSNSSVSTFEFKDLDGAGGNEPSVFDTIRLTPNTNYEGEIVILDQSKNPTDTITYEIEEEADEHQFFFQSSGSLGLTVTYDAADVDANGVPIGLFPIINTGANTGIGSLTITLKHQGADKPKTGNGNINIGDTDIEIEFPVKIQN